MSEVRRTTDLARVQALPRRTVTHEEAVRRAAAMTRELKRHNADVALKPWQGYMLWEAMTHPARGGYGELPVGAGKTLIFWLDCVVSEAENPVMVVPPALVEDTLHLFAQYARDWAAPKHPPRLITYWDLTHEPNFREGERSLLDRLGADRYGLDEAHKLRNQDRSAPKRLGRDISRRNVPCLTMTGTGSRNTLLNYSHLLVWSLKEGAPVPLDPDECGEWAAAIDEAMPRDGFRPDPAALFELTPGAGEHFGPMARARIAFRDRLTETPGVLIISEDSCDQPLRITLKAAPEDPVVDGHFKRFREDGETPSGRVIEDVFSRISNGTWLGCGGHYEWDPAAPKPWKDACTAAAKFVRKQIQEHGDDEWSPLNTRSAVERRHGGEPVIQDWAAIKPTFKPNSVYRWLSGSVVFYAAEWAKRAPGLVWCLNTAVAEAIQEVTGLDYYAAKGRDKASGRHILTADPTKSHILSFDANLEGRNLQAWNRWLLIGCTTSALELEQFLGRSHRFGQLRPVEGEILVTSSETVDAWHAVMREANFVLATKGVEQKVLRTEVVRDIHVNSESPRWFAMR